MYEDVTYEAIIRRMLDRVSDKLDKREGSVIWDTHSPTAIELQILYIELDTILREAYGDTASREFLVLRCKERGILPEEATHTILKGEFTPANIDVTGQRFNLGSMNYIVTEKITDGEYKVKCETTGIIGNQYLGTMIPIEYIAGLETAELTEILIPGEDEEDTEDLRNRYFSSFDEKAFGGNRKDYIVKTNAIAGVGSTKVTPVWNGGGTVKLTILDSTYGTANSVLIQFVQQTIDPTQDGEGWGLAPIGHIVTVETADPVDIIVNTTITFAEGYSWSNLQSQIDAAMEAYLLELRETWADNEYLIVRVSQIETRILNIAGIIDIKETKINGVTDNLTLGMYDIPQYGGASA